jgi:CRISPR-associated protein Csy3
MPIKLTTNMLSYSRSLEVTAATLRGMSWENPDKGFEPVVVQTEGVRGQSSHANDKKGNAGKSNPQLIDVARMPVGRDALCISFSLRAMPNALAPAAADDAEVHRNLKDFVADYADADGFEALAWRYIENLANGRFAWRNRSLSSNAIVSVEHNNVKVAFDPFKFSLDEIQGKDAIVAAMVSGTEDDLEEIKAALVAGLTRSPEVLRVSWLGKVEELAEVYPSQEYAGTDKTKLPAGTPSRILAAMKTRYHGEIIRQAVMHPQKIGAAIRCIDDWHGSEEYGPVPVNPFAGVQEAGEVLRFGKKNVKSFYDLIKKPDDMAENVSGANLTGDCHFFIANLVRGGVFGSK